jgi:hypothetical protein
MLGYGVAFVIAIGIALVVLDANESSEIVDAWLDACRFLVGPFDDVFDLERGKEHEQIAINWGIAAVVYLVVASVLGGIIDRAGKVRT